MRASISASANHEEDYKLLLADCMYQFQMLEEALKIAIGSFEIMTTSKIDGDFPYRWNHNSIENAPLGRLIEYFKKFTVDEELLQLLKEVKKKRDHISHKAFLFYKEGQAPSKELTLEAKLAKSEAEVCFHSIMEILLQHEDSGA